MTTDKRAMILGGGGSILAAAAALALVGAPLSLPMMRPEREHFAILDDAQGTPRNRNRTNKKLKAKLGMRRSRRPVAHSSGGRHGGWSEDQAIIQRLTNWQRSQWARAGYPQKTLADIQAFAEMRRRA